MKKLFAILAFALTLAACGGGGGSGGDGGSSTPSSAGGSQTPPPSASVASNVVSVTVEPFGNTVNAPYVSVTICTPGTSNCATIDHVMVDTGSTGLRLLRSAIPASLGLTNVAAPGNAGTMAECSEFGSGHAWGPVSTVDMKIGSESANNLRMQIIDDSFASVPADCSSYGPDMVAQGAQSFGANGLIGVDIARQDCAASCGEVEVTIYYACNGSSCTPVVMPLANQVPNPVTLFASDNNGVNLSFPAVPTGGSATVTGTMTFGINTQSNNMLGTVTKLAMGDTGTFTSVYNGAGARSILDTGSGAYFLPDSTISQCPTSFSSSPWFCPSGMLTRTAMLVGQLGGYQNVDFDIANAMSELSGNSNAAHAGIGENANLFGAGLVDLGMPFFYGKTITFGIQSSDDWESDTAPYFAIHS